MSEAHWDVLVTVPMIAGHGGSRVGPEKEQAGQRKLHDKQILYL